MGKIITRALSKEEMNKIIQLASSGFTYTGDDGKEHKFYANDTLVMILKVQYATAMRLGDVLNLKLNNIVEYAPERFRWNVKEQKTGKIRRNEIDIRLVTALKEYAKKNHIAEDGKLFQVTTRAINKQLKIITNYLNLNNVASHSIRKGGATALYKNTNKDILQVQRLLMHSNVETTMRYINVSDEEFNEALSKNILF